MIEYDQEVLEYFDQPCTIELHYQGPSGRPTQARHTPDFLVIRRDGAYLEERKPENKLLELMVTHPGRYQRDEQGNWRCPPGEEAAARLGLTYRVRSSAELHPTSIRNLIFLDDYFFESTVSYEALTLILETVEAEPGISLATLRERHPRLGVDPVYALIARNRLYVDLYTELLKEHQRLHLYLDRPTAEAHALIQISQSQGPFGRIGVQTPSVNLTTLQANTPLLWDGRRWWLLHLGDTTTALLPEVGTLVQMETIQFLHLVDTQVITIPGPSLSPAASLSAEVHHLLTQAGPEALDTANQRYRLLEAYQNEQKDAYQGTPPRTIRDWRASFRDAEGRYGCGYVGLLPKTAARGNRNPKAPEAPRRLLEEAIEQFYARPKQQKARQVFFAYQRTCLEHQVQPISERSFYRSVKKRSSPAPHRTAQGSTRRVSGKSLTV